MVDSRSGTLRCIVCDKAFTRTGTRGPVPKYCSDACRAKKQRERPERREYERAYQKTAKAKATKQRYAQTYNRLPEVRERSRLRWHTNPAYRKQQQQYKRDYYRSPEYKERFRIRWATDREFRLKRLRAARERYERLHPFNKVPIPAPFTGHRWLDMARNVVAPMVDPSTPWADDYYDDMGEALLALLEGRDMKQAVKDYRRREFVSRRLTMRIGDWHDDEEEAQRWFDRSMPTSPSAEDEALDNMVETPYTEARHRHRSSKRSGRHMGTKTQQPSRRRMNNGKGWRRTGYKDGRN